MKKCKTKNQEYRFFKIVTAIKEAEAPKKTTPLIEIFEQSSKIVSSMLREDKGSTIEGLCSLFVTCIKNNEYFNSDYNFTSPLKGGESTDELISIFREKIGYFLKNKECGGVSFILGIIDGLGYAPLDTIEEYLSNL